MLEYYRYRKVQNFLPELTDTCNEKFLYTFKLFVKPTENSDVDV